MDPDKIEILMVDDNPRNLFALEVILEHPSYNLIGFSSGNEALEFLRDHDVAVALIDVMMPVMDGFELAKRMKEDNRLKEIPVIFLTAMATESDQVFKGYRYGAVDYIQKPLSEEIVQSKVAVFAQLFQSRKLLQRQAHEIQEWNRLLEQRVKDRTERLQKVNEELFESREDFRLLSESIPQIVWTASHTGEILHCNHAWERYSGESAAETMSRPCWARVHPDDLERTKTKWSESIQKAQAFEEEHRIKRFDETYRWHLTRALPQYGKDGRPVKWFGTTTDIEETKRNERRFADLYHTAEKMNRLRDEFLAVLSHELRTPLSIIIGYSELLKAEMPKAEDYEVAIDVIQRNASMQHALISQLLDVSRVITGKMSLDPEFIDFAEMVRTTVDSFKLALRAKNISLSTDISSKSNIILGDMARLQQVLWNLISNAIKFTPEGGMIDVNVKEAEGRFTVEVKDSGEGIDPVFLPYVFDRFRQEDASKTRKHGGLGLGLAIVRHIVELHGGSVFAESEGKNRGSKFIIQLPFFTIDKSKYVRDPAQGPASKDEKAS